MLKILAAAGTAVICTAAGAVFSSALKKRCEQLRVMLSVLDEMSARIRYSPVRMSEMIADIAVGSGCTGCSFMRQTAAGLQRGETANEAWCNAARGALFLGENDRRILADIGGRLGESDTEGQLSMLSLGMGMLSRELEAAERDAAGKSRTLMSVWTLCGIGAGIIII